MFLPSPNDWAAGVINDIHLSMKSPGSGRSLCSTNARTPPQCECPITMMYLTLRLSRRIGRHQVCDVARDKEFAWMSVKDDVGRDARIATANHHDLRMLSGFGELLEAASFGRKPRCLKG